MTEDNTQAAECLSHLTAELGTISDEQRFYVDERVGCIAVRDRTKDDKWCSGLSKQMDGVKAFWTGVSSKDEKGNFKQWDVLDWQRKEANELCDLLNTGV